jgi:hypothetical protein
MVKNQYDFDDGTMSSFIAPNQIISVDSEENRNSDVYTYFTRFNKHTH